MDPESEARRLIRRTRSRAARHGVLRAVFRGTTAGALLAAAAAGVGWILGAAPGPWLLLAAAPALAVAAVGAARARPGPAAAAMLLDRAAGTRERFLATLAAADPEVRALVARQAVGSPAVAGRRSPVEFPPSTEGLAATVSLAFLAGLLLLLPPPAGGAAAGDARPRAPGVASASGDDAGDPDPDAAVRPAPEGASAAERVVETVAAGTEPTAEDWEALREAGLTEEERDRAAASIAEGESEAAAAALRAALERARRSAASPETARARAWGRYGASLDSPGWSPRFDEVVRRYYVEAERSGLR